MSLKILILNYEYPPLGGGAGIMTRRLAEELSQKKHKVTVLTSWFRELEEHSKRENLEIIRLKSKLRKLHGSNPMEMYSWMKESLKYLKSQENCDYDVCLCNFTLPGGPVANYLKEAYNIPYVILSHGHDIPWFFPKQMWFWHSLCYFKIKSICQKSTFNILLTNEMKENADNFLGKSSANKNIIVPNGLDLEIGHQPEKPDDILRIIFVGRFVDQKDPLHFIKVAERINKLGIPAKFKMFGDGPLMQKATKIILDNNIKNIECLGMVSNKRIILEMKKAHIMLAPSSHEAMSISVLEAISCGVYVISTPVSGNKQIIINNLNGKLVPHGDTLAMLEEIEDFYQTKFRKDVQIPESYDEHIEQYAWPNIIEQYEEILLKAAKEKSL